MQPRNVPYYETRPLFGPDVFNNFSSANDDIDEAGKCLALGRGTACVMHLMRVLEVGLAALASALGANKQLIGADICRRLIKSLRRGLGLLALVLRMSSSMQKCP